MSTLTCFNAYDIRGKLGAELNEDIAYRVARAYAEWLKPRCVVLGADARESSPVFKAALARGLCDAGVNVLDLGMTGTEEVYFATQHLGADGGIEVTASHNPINYNGFKLVREGSQPISTGTGLEQIRRIAERGEFAAVAAAPGEHRQVDCRAAYIEHLLSYIDCGRLEPLKLVVNAGNGAAGPVLDAIEAELVVRGVPFEFIKVNHQPDSRFPHGIPNPMLEENRAVTRNAVLAHGADLGIAWDGDFDRCFLFDERGEFIDGYYTVGLLAEAFLLKEAGARIIHDPRLTWNTQEIVACNGGEPVQSKAGDAFIKACMREQDAIYGGEVSGHHYFRDFAYNDSGMIPWLLVAELICTQQKPLSALVGERIRAFPSSGEINLKVIDTTSVLAHIESLYSAESQMLDYTDGLSISFADWRFNLRAANTEPVIRLNVESRADTGLMRARTDELLVQISWADRLKSIFA